MAARQLPPTPQQQVVLRHVRAKFTRTPAGVPVPEVPTQLTPEQERDAQRRGYQIRK
jgi:hypothetical protein